MTDDRMDEIIRSAARDYNLPPVDGAPREEIWARVQRARQAPRAVERSPATPAPRREWIWRGIGIAAILVLGIGIGRFVERRHGATGDSASPQHRVAAAPIKDSGRIADTAALRPSDVVSPSTAGVDAASRNTPDATTSVFPPARSTRDLADRGRDANPDRDDPLARSENTDGLALRLALVKHLAGTEAMLTSFRTSARSGEVDAQLLVWARDLLRTTRLLQTSAASAHDPALRRLLDDLELVLLQISQYTAKASDHAQELELIERSIEKRGVIAKLRTNSTPAGFPAGT